MLQPEKMFFSRMYSDGAATLTALKSRGLTHNVFTPIYRPVLGYVEQYVAKHGQLPPQQDLLEKFPSFKASDLFGPVPEAPLSAVYEAVVGAALRGDIQSALQEVIDAYNDSGVDPHDVLAKISDTSASLTAKYTISSADTQTLSQAARVFLDELDNGEIIVPGIAPSLLFIEDQAGGWQPGDLTTIAALSGVGKSWLLCMNAVTATTGNPYHFYDQTTLPSGVEFLTKEQRAQRKKRVLFFSLEMSVKQVYRRLAALYARVSYARYRENKLTDDEMRRMRRVLELFANDTSDTGLGASIKVVGPGSVLSPESIYAAAEEFKADVVMIDAFYLMPGKGEERWQQVEYNMQQLRLGSLMSNRHYMLTTQLKKTTGRTLASTDLDSLSFSSSIGHDSTTVIALVQSKNDAHAGICYVTPVKRRDGIPGQEYLYSWNHQDGIYHQQGLVVDDDTSFSNFT